MFAHFQAIHDAQLTPDREPTEAETAERVASILAHLCRSPVVWHEAVSEQMSHDRCGPVGEAFRDGENAKAYRLMRDAALDKIKAEAIDLAERSFYDNFSADERKMLKGWKP